MEDKFTLDRADWESTKAAVLVLGAVTGCLAAPRWPDEAFRQAVEQLLARQEADLLASMAPDSMVAAWRKFAAPYRRT